VITQSLIGLLRGQPIVSDPVRGPEQAALMNKLNGAVYLDRAPQGQGNPFIVVRQMSGDHARAINGGRMGQEQGTAQLDVYAASPAEAAQLASDVGAFLDCFQGHAGPGGNQWVQGIFQLDTDNNLLPPVHADEWGNPDVSLVFQVFQNE